MYSEKTCCRKDVPAMISIRAPLLLKKYGIPHFYHLSVMPVSPNAAPNS